MQLLLVEDDRESGDSLKLMLEKRGMSVVWLRTAEEAIARWRGGGFDVVVSDIRLAGMSGVDFLHDLRELDSAFPFILLTGFDSLETAIRAVRLGAQDYILKPLNDIDVLLRPVRNAVEHYRLLLHSRSVETALRESERRLSTLMGNLAGMVYRCRMDRYWTMEFVSGGCRDLLGCDPNDLLGNRRLAYADLIHPDDRERVEETVRSSVEQGLPFRIEYRVLTLQKQLKWVWGQGIAVPADGAQPCRLEGLIEDITERKNAESGLRELNAELEQRVKERTAELQAANREMEAFSYSVSHDLRGHLRSVIGFCQATLEDHGAGLSNGGRANLGRVLAAAQRMSAVVDALLRLFRMTRQPMAKERVDLSRLAREESCLLEEGDPSRHVELVIADGLFVEGDPELLRVAVQNLLGNAWKFTRGVQEARIEVGCSDQDVFFVKDNGAGFDPVCAGRLFVPFQRLHRSEEYPGTGIGLTIVQRIIQRHCGRIWAEGQVGRGATFFFAF